MPNPRNLLRRRPLLALLILILLLIIGYTARALDHANKGAAPGRRSGYATVTVMPTQFTEPRTAAAWH
jgi:hypothetical protein